jgi:hypothetical protein
VRIIFVDLLHNSLGQGGKVFLVILVVIEAIHDGLHTKHFVQPVFIPQPTRYQSAAESISWIMAAIVGRPSDLGADPQQGGLST